MRILQVTPYFGEHYGGTERYCFNLSRALADMGHEVHVYAARMKATSLRREKEAGLKIHRFPTPTTIWNINPLTVMLHRLVANEFDIVHAHSYLYFTSNQALLAKILRNSLRKKSRLILHLHGGLGIPPYLNLQPTKRVAKQVYDATVGKLMMRGADHILSACKSDALLAQQQFTIPNHKISIVYNAIDTQFFENSKKDGGHTKTPYLLFVGDLERWKGLRSLIRAIGILKERGLIFSLKIAGVGGLEEALRKMADGLDVQFLGAIPHAQIPALMRSAYAFVLPSYWEGIPTVGIEAMASKTPFIGTNVGGIPELISSGETGFLVPPDSPGEIASAVQLLEDQGLRNKIIMNATKLIHQKFTIENVTKHTLDVYQRVLHR